jgi:hypothetical protein
VTEAPHARVPTPPAPVKSAPGGERTFAPDVSPVPVEAAAAAVAAPAQELVRAQPAARVFASPPRPATTAAAPAAIAVSRGEEPAVRVHIGRLEVRANLQAAPPPDRRPREHAIPAGPSLSDYLRGGSEAR